MSAIIDPSTGLPVDFKSTEVDWPTGKPHVSYSELANWLECSWRHKLLYIEKLGTFSTTPHVGLGTACHNANEYFISKGTMNKQIAFDFIRKDWKDNHEAFMNGPFPDWSPGGYGNVDDWLKKADNILNSIPKFLNKEFPGWECFGAEERLYEPIEGLPISLKGFIDAVFKVMKKNGKVIYWIIDWKTCGWGWTRHKKQDFKVQLQLILYKSFWAKKHNIPLKDIRCAFALLKRDAKIGSPAVQLVPVSVGPKAEAKGLNIIKNHAKAVKKGFFLKNRDSCRFCDFENTEHCKNSM